MERILESLEFTETPHIVKRQLMNIYLYYEAKKMFWTKNIFIILQLSSVRAILKQRLQVLPNQD